MTWEDSLITVYIIAYISTGYNYNFNGGNIEKEDFKNVKVQNSRAKIVSRDEISHISQIKIYFHSVNLLDFFKNSVVF
jgi:hypothetical protein